MAEPGPPTTNAPLPETAAPAGARSRDDIAVDMMKFIAVTTGYGRATQSSTGFSGKPIARSAEEHAEALLELFQRCRRALDQK